MSVPDGRALSLFLGNAGQRREQMVARFVVAVGLSLVGVAGGVAQQGSGTAPAAGEARVNGKSIALAHAYLMHAPDNWREEEVNAVVLLTPPAAGR